MVLQILIYPPAEGLSQPHAVVGAPVFGVDRQGIGQVESLDGGAVVWDTLGAVAGDHRLAGLGAEDELLLDPARQPVLHIQIVAESINTTRPAPQR
jgi:hypothetical protein